MLLRVEVGVQSAHLAPPGIIGVARVGAASGAEARPGVTEGDDDDAFLDWSRLTSTTLRRKVSGTPPEGVRNFSRGTSEAFRNSSKDSASWNGHGGSVGIEG